MTSGQQPIASAAAAALPYNANSTLASRGSHRRQPAHPHHPHLLSCPVRGGVLSTAAPVTLGPWPRLAQPLSQRLAQFRGPVLVEVNHARAIDMGIKHDRSVALADQQIGEPHRTAV